MAAAQVEVSVGEHAKHGISSSAASLTRVSEVERVYAADRGLAEGRRLGCTAGISADVVIDVPPESQVYRQVVRKEVGAHPIEIDPVVRLDHVEAAEPDLANPASDLRRLQEALQREWGLANLDLDLIVLEGLQKTLRAGDWRVTAAVHDGDTITGVWPGLQDRAYGIAFDVGSTSQVTSAISRAARYWPRPAR